MSTATRGDEAGTVWLARAAASLGAEITSWRVVLVRVLPIACYLNLDGVRISGVPSFDTPATGNDGIAGRLSLDIRKQGIPVPS